MSKINSLTENKYTLSDLFTEKCQIWLMVPLFIYCFTPVLHMIIYSVLYSNELNHEQVIHYFVSGSMPGNYYSEIIIYSFVICTVIAAIAVVSYISNSRKYGVKQGTDIVPMCIFSAYILLIIVSTIINKTPSAYIFGFTSRAEGVLSVIGYFMIFYLCASLVRNEKYKYILIYFFLAVGTIIGILSLINAYCVDINIIDDESMCGIWGHANFYAYFLSISIMLSASLVSVGIHKAGRIFAFIVFIMDTVILAIDDSLGGFLACIVAFIFLFAAVSYKKRRISFLVLLLFAMFLGVIFVVGLFTPSFFSELGSFGKDIGKIVNNAEDAGSAGTARWTLWTHTAQYIKEKPFIGWGFEGTAERLGTETHTSKAHNEYLENMAYYGIPAGLIYIGGLMSIYFKALKRRRYVDNATLCCLAGALAYIASAFVGNSFIYISPFFFIFLGLGNTTADQSSCVSGRLETDSENVDVNQLQVEEYADDIDSEIDSDCTADNNN